MFEVIVRYRFVSIKIFKLKYLEFYIVLLFKINLAMSQKITGTKGNRSNRMTKSQKDFMVNFLEKNKFLLETKINPFELDKYNNSWKLLANELNKLPGANKSIPQWKQVEIGIEEYIPSNETMDSPIPSNDQTWPSTSFKVVSDASKMGTIPKDSPMKTKQAMRNSKKYMKTSGVELIAKNHEECLKYLANSNNNVAAACHNLSKILKRRETKCSVFNLRF
ncbi:hypothetical protein NQ314_007974 [Rhamnusium bicolor]|uniref:Myb/SANT-like domain-containing protein n=1 Tax=Rhamnusium bicolor TaxID=1586634 RepID=A0AAV8YEL4_9CUCU|nr:hypothetical protein NQ314_007974 [Rhamnusium bicolor]